MIDPRATIREKYGVALTTALTAAGYSVPATRITTNPYDDTPLPYIQLNQMSYQPWSTRTAEGANTRHTFMAVAESATEAYLVAGIIINKLGRLKLSLASPHEVIMAKPDDIGEDSLLEWEAGDKLYYSVLVRMRYHTMETA